MLEFDFSELLGLIVQKYGTQGNFAKAANTSEKSLSDKLNGKHKKGLTQRDIYLWANLLEIDGNSIGRVFFNPKVQKFEH